jgi:hypothetical protein
VPNTPKMLDTTTDLQSGMSLIELYHFGIVERDKWLLKYKRSPGGKFPSLSKGRSFDRKIDGVVNDCIFKTMFKTSDGDGENDVDSDTNSDSDGD